MLTVSRAVDVLMAFVDSDVPDLGVTEIHRQLGLSKAVIHRILTTLATKGLVTTNPRTRRYQLGPGALALGQAYMEHFDLRSVALGVLRRLSDATDETATLSLRHDDVRIYVDQVTPQREVHMSVPLGKPFPLHAGSSSKAFLAFMPAEFQEDYLARHELKAITESTITDVARLRADLEEIRARGYAVSYGERQPGAGSVAAPVLDTRSEPVAVMSLCGPIERFRKHADDHAKLLVEASSEVSRNAGHRAGARTA